MEDKQKKRRRQGQGFLIWLVMLTLMLIGVLYFVLGQSRIRQIRITGSRHYNDEAIIAMVGLDDNSTVMEVFLRQNSTLDYLPYIEEAVISYDSFNSVHIQVTEKTVTSYIPFQSQFLALDKDGYIVGYEKEKVMDLPSVTGLYVQSAVVGEKLPVEEEVLDAMLNIYHMGSKYGVRFDEIEFLRGDSSMIQCYMSNITVVMGDSSDMERKMSAAREVLSKLDSQVKGTLDLQIPGTRYIFKEDLSIDTYIAVDEGYLAVDDQGIVRKISPHRLVDRTLIVGLEPESYGLNERVIIDGDSWSVIERLRAICDHEGFFPEIVDMSQMDEGKVVLTVEDIMLKIIVNDDLERRLKTGLSVIGGLENDKKGTLDLTSEKDVYTLEEVGE